MDHGVVGRTAERRVVALIARGRLDEAERVTTVLETRGVQVDGCCTPLAAARCRALVLAARGNDAAAEKVLVRTLEAHPYAPPLEQGRCLLALARVERRGAPRAADLTTCECALAIFTHVGALGWAERARREPAGCCRGANGRRAASSLTETELRVVELVASGLNDRAIASQLSLSPNAVQANLRRVYCKLGITTRAALAADRFPVS